MNLTFLADKFLCLPQLKSITVLLYDFNCELGLYHYDVASGIEITTCNKICKPLVVYLFSGNVMTSITTLRT